MTAMFIVAADGSFFSKSLLFGSNPKCDAVLDLSSIKTNVCSLYFK